VSILDISSLSPSNPADENSDKVKSQSWFLFSQFAYVQMIKHLHRRRTFKVNRCMLWNDEHGYRSRLKQAGLSGRISTAFVKRTVLNICLSVCKLTHRTWGPAHYFSRADPTSRVEALLQSHHRNYDSLVFEFSHPIQRNGCQKPQRYRRRTPAIAAGLTNRRWDCQRVNRLPIVIFFPSGGTFIHGVWASPGSCTCRSIR
jgi:hypothetical protein